MVGRHMPQAYTILELEMRGTRRFIPCTLLCYYYLGLRDILPLYYTLDIEHGQGKTFTDRMGTVWSGGGGVQSRLYAHRLLTEWGLVSFFFSRDKVFGQRPHKYGNV